MSTPPAVTTIEVMDFARFWSQHETAVNRIAKAWNGPPAYVEPLIISALRRFARFAFLCPASERSHDHQVGGLVAHTLTVIERALAASPSHYSWEDRLAVIIIATVHDAARVWLMEVRCATTVERKDEYWEPNYESMLSWIERVKATRLTITWIPKRPQTGVLSTESLGSILISHFFNLSIIPLLGRRRANAVVWAMARSIGTPANDYYSVFKAADIFSAQRAVQGTPSQQWMSGLRDLIQSDATVMNTPEGDVWVSATHTIIALPEQKGTSTWQILVDAVVSRSHRPRADVEQEIRAYDSQCVGAGSTLDPTERRTRITHPVLLDQERIVHCRIFANSVLGLADGAVEPYQGELAILANGRGAPTITAASLGFRPLTPPPHLVAVQPLAGKAKDGEHAAPEDRERLFKQMQDRKSAMAKLYLAGVTPQATGRAGMIRTACAAKMMMPDEHFTEALHILYALDMERAAKAKAQTPCPAPGPVPTSQGTTPAQDAKPYQPHPAPAAKAPRMIDF